MDRDLYVIAHNIRSTYNIGALFRLADGLGLKHLYLTGYTPYPQTKDDQRLPHLSKKLHSQISKTALGAEQTMAWSYSESAEKIIEELKQSSVLVAALEQHANATPLNEFYPAKKVALLLGEEVSGINPELMQQCDQTVEIPMLGAKESHNVMQAAAMALFHCRFTSQTV